MSKTFRNSNSGVRTDGGRHYSTPRYRSGSRRKPHRITAVGVRRVQPDFDLLGRAIARTVLAQTVGFQNDHNNEAKTKDV